MAKRLDFELSEESQLFERNGSIEEHLFPPPESVDSKIHDIIVSADSDDKKTLRGMTISPKLTYL